MKCSFLAGECTDLSAEAKGQRHRLTRARRKEHMAERHLQLALTTSVHTSS